MTRNSFFNKYILPAKVLYGAARNSAKINRIGKKVMGKSKTKRSYKQVGAGSSLKTQSFPTRGLSKKQRIFRKKVMDVVNGIPAKQHLHRNPFTGNGLTLSCNAGLQGLQCVTLFGVDGTAGSHDDIVKMFELSDGVELLKNGGGTVDNGPIPSANVNSSYIDLFSGVVTMEFWTNGGYPHFY